MHSHPKHVSKLPLIKTKNNPKFSFPIIFHPNSFIINYMQISSWCLENDFLMTCDIILLGFDVCKWNIVYEVINLWFLNMWSTTVLCKTWSDTFSNGAWFESANSPWIMNGLSKQYFFWICLLITFHMIYSMRQIWLLNCR